MHVRIAAIVSCLLLIACSTFAWAGSNTWSQSYIDAASKYQQKLLDAKTSLESRDPAQWIDAELADYQVNMGVAVYNAVVAYCIDNQRLPDRLEDVTGQYLSAWPLNPLNNWEPVQVLGLGDAFSAGDIVFQTCPFSYYSIAGRIKDQTLTAQSFELSVYGPSIDHYQETSLNLANKDWGIIPTGAIISMGMYTEPAVDVLVRYRASEQAEMSPATGAETQPAVNAGSGESQ